MVKVWTADEKGYGSVAGAGAREAAVARDAVHDEKRRGDEAERAEASRWDACRAV